MLKIHPNLDQYKGIIQIASLYWSRYGGLGSLVGSPYLHLAILLCVPCYAIWGSPNWWDLPLSVLPGLIYFTLAGFAMLIAFGDDGFKRHISDKN